MIVEQVSADQALTMLMEGNERFVNRKLLHPNQSLERRREVAQSQRPFAVVLGCSDSRVPPEVIFDQGIGDLFVIRIAGNILNDGILGSMEYAVEHLGTSLIMVLGHQRCGAVEATVKAAEAPGHIPALLTAIRPAVEEGKGRPGDLLENAIRANVRRVVSQLKDSRPILAEEVHQGHLRVVGAHYDLESGRVEVLESGNE
jgi:carbonic anhydrase